MGYENALAELDVDINIDAIPDTANLAQEQFLQLTELARLYGPQEVPFDDLLELSSMPEKAKLIAKRKERQEQMAAQQAQAQEMQQQIAMQGAVAEIENTQADTAYLAARAQNELMKPQLEAFKAGFGAA